MRTTYTCIGGCVDIDGFSLIRFDLVDTKFRLLRSVTSPKPGYDTILREIEKLADSPTTTEIQTMDVLGDFGDTLKTFIVKNNTSQHKIRIRSTDSANRREDMILNLMNAINQERLICPPDSVLIGVMEELRKLDKARIQKIYEGNETLNQLLDAILHSVAWLESQMIKHGII